MSYFVSLKFLLQTLTGNGHKRKIEMEQGVEKLFICSEGKVHEGVNCFGLRCSMLKYG
jgi:hypothetical protein